MKLKQSKNEKGYSLVETLAAVAIFLSVLIPLITIVGNFFLDSSTQRIHTALRLAETEIDRTITREEYTANRSTTDDGYVIIRTVNEAVQYHEITVSVETMKKPGKTILELRKTVLRHD